MLGTNLKIEISSQEIKDIKKNHMEIWELKNIIINFFLKFNGWGQQNAGDKGKKINELKKE